MPTSPPIDIPLLRAWTVPRTTLNLPTWRAIQRDPTNQALRRGLDSQALKECERILHVGTAAELAQAKLATPELTVITDLSLEQARIPQGKTIFLNPPTRVFAFRHPSIIPPTLQQALADAKADGKDAIWTWEWQDLFDTFDVAYWHTLNRMDWVQWLGLLEWRRRVKAVKDQQPVIPDQWTREEHQVAEKRFKAMKLECMNVYWTWQNTSEQKLPPRPKLPPPPSFAMTGPRSIFLESRDPCHDKELRGLDVAGLTNAKWIVRFTREKKDGYIPFLPSVHANKVRTGELIFPSPPSSATTRKWPRLLAPTLWFALRAMETTGKPAWHRDYQSIFDSVTPEEWEQLNLEQWEDYLAVQELGRRHDCLGGKEIKKDILAAEERFRKRRKECLILFELHHQHQSSSMFDEKNEKQGYASDDDEEDEEDVPPVASSSYLSTLKSWVKPSPLTPPVVPPRTS
ncbi:hypothetical protein JCM10213_008969 [Rhodosporidiobolus nylandii]